MKKLFSFACAALLAAAGPASAQSTAQNYPSQPITWVVPFAPGGAADVGVRLIAKALGERLRQPVVVDNKAGAGGITGSQFVVRSRPDGYTMLYGTSGTIATNPFLYKNHPFDTQRDLIPVHGMSDSPAVLLVNPKRPYKTLSQLVEYAKKNPGKVNYASAGPGTTTHLSAELLAQVTGISMTHVPYKGSAPALTDLMAGVVDVLFDYPVTTLPLARDGKVLPVVVLADERVKLMADVPTIAELGYPSGVLGAWSGIFVPRGTPPEIVATLGAAFEDALRDPAVVKSFHESGRVLLTNMNADRFAPFVRNEMGKWKQLIDQSGAKVE